MALFLEILTNAADILILSYVIYKILILLKDNRAMQLIKGLVLLFLLYFVSDWLRLDTINFILGQSWAAVFIGIVIIFQPELRSLLEHLGGKGNLLNPVKQEPKERLILDLMHTLRSAAETKTGTLIVLEGKTGLKEYVNTGTRLDAVVSEELLGNLFFKNSPLHDGAVIIRGNRIA
ncbi:MAG: diadenylate cyclase, partial [Firmicutes bacterium]|nr:diadenylate cyclase [Bacillota bacterium]